MTSAFVRHLPTWAKRAGKAVLPGEHVRWATSFSDRQWAWLLASDVKRLAANGVGVVVLLTNAGRNARLADELTQRLDARRVVLVDTSPSGSDAGDIVGLLPAAVRATDPASCVFVACSTVNADVQRWLAMVMAKHEYSRSTFLYKIRAADSYGALTEADRINDDDRFVGSLFDDGIINEVYLESLSRVDQKYEVRDAYDLYQGLLQTRDVPGPIFEFGSYRGHSGLILVEAMRRLGIDKPVYLCDTFEQFPPEHNAVDKFWNDSHYVDFPAVERLFSAYDNVTLLRGDFEETSDRLPRTGPSLVHVDCDSYRAVRFVSELVFPRMPHRGVMFFEDYGHDFCLGARLAVDEFFDGRTDCFRFFSAFSGAAVVAKV